jgi:tetratricopeptide (TPR) repeat protein
LAFASGLQRFWEIQSRWTEGSSWLRDALARPASDAAHRAKAHKTLGVMQRCLGNLDEAEAECERATGLYVAARDEVGAAACLNNQGVLALDRDAYGRAVGLFRRALEICEAHGDERRVALVLNNLGLVTIETGDLRTAVRLCRRSWELLAEQGNLASQNWSEDNLGSALTMAGHPRWAVSIHERTVRQRLHMGDENGFTWSLEALAAAWIGTGAVEQGGRALGFVAAHRRRLGTIPVPHLMTLTRRRRNMLVARVGETRTAELWEEGGALEPAVVRSWFTD